LHLTEHIRRFGPAILFATEAFESFNAIIRAKSVHSNRHAPSRDIALAFAQSNRIRHLLSGGKFDIQSLADNTALDSGATATPVMPNVHPEFSFKQDDWRNAGAGASGLVHIPNTVTQYLGLDDKTAVKAGKSQKCLI
jgi:hypothetical protein